MKVRSKLTEGLLKEGLSIRPTEYRGRQGFLVTGSLPGQAFPAKVFTRTREGAEAVKTALLRGDHAAVDAVLKRGE